MVSCLHETKEKVGKGFPQHPHRMRVLLTPEENTIVHRQLLHPDEVAMSLTSFTRLARHTGWSLIPSGNTSED